MLLSAEGIGTNEIVRRIGKSKTCVWRWQERFMQEGAAGLLRDKTRPSRIAPLGPKAAARVVALTQGEPPGETTHWTGAMMAKAAGIFVSSVQRIWRSHGLRPHRVRQFKLSNDRNFVPKLRDVVGLHVDPLDRRSRQNHRRRQARTPSVGFCPLGKQIGLDGATWLDRRLIHGETTDLVPTGFGQQVREAMDRRREHRIEQGDATRARGGRIFCRRSLLATLREREVACVGAEMAAGKGLSFREVMGVVQVGSVSWQLGRQRDLEPGIVG